MLYSRVMYFMPLFGDEPPVPPAGGEPPPPPPSPPAPPPPPSFSQKDVDAIVAKRVAEEKAKAARDREQLTKQVQEFNLTKQEKEALEARLEEIRVASLSKEEQAKVAAEKAKREHADQLKKVSEERDQIFNTYKEEKIEREILGAVTAPDVFDSNQMADLLRSKSRMAPEVDTEGKPTGRQVVKVKHKLVQDGKPVEVELTPAEVVKAMRDDPSRYGNQFVSAATGGIGAPPGGVRPTNAGKSKPEDIPMDKFVEMYHKDPTQLGLQRRPRGLV